MRQVWLDKHTISTEQPSHVSCTEAAWKLNNSLHGLREALLLRQLRAHCDEVRHDGHDVDDVHDGLGELRLARAREEAHEQLESEPNDTRGLDDEEGVGEGEGRPRRGAVVQPAGDRKLPLIPELWQRLQAEGDDGYGDDNHRHDGDAPRRT